MLEARPLTLEGVIIRIVLAVIVGGIIGVERGVKNRPAGLRTYMLVSIGACVVMLINQYSYQIYQTGDPVRLGSQVISGIGFLGAGTIIVTSHNQIKGLTTAAGLWASACLGLAVGIGLYEVVIIGGLAIYIVLTVIHEWDFRMHCWTREMDVYIELSRDVSLGAFIRNARVKNLDVSNLQRERDMGAADEITAYVITIRGRKSIREKDLVEMLRKIEGVMYLEVL